MNYKFNPNGSIANALTSSVNGVFSQGTREVIRGNFDALQFVSFQGRARNSVGQVTYDVEVTGPGAIINVSSPAYPPGPIIGPIPLA